MELKEKSSEQEPIFQADKDGFVNFGEVSRQILKKQAQYGSRYVNGDFGEYPKLGEGLRFKGNSDDYHNLKVHKDDIKEFTRRFNEYQKEQ